MLVLLAARGRGIAQLIEGLYNGEPGAWSVLIGIVVIAAAWYGLKFYLASRATNEST